MGQCLQFLIFIERAVLSHHFEPGNEATHCLLMICIHPITKQINSNRNSCRVRIHRTFQLNPKELSGRHLLSTGTETVSRSLAAVDGDGEETKGKNPILSPELKTK